VRLDLVVGPNGAGKTTFIRKVLRHSVTAGSVFVNADEIAAQRWPDEPERMSYAAAEVADATRQALISAGRPLIAETVFSHRSKIDLITDAQEANYTVALHVLLVPEDLAVVRVKYRVASGGHSVPEAKVRQRYQRLWGLVAEAIEMCDSSSVYDNSAHGGPRIVAQLVYGVPIGVLAWPPWTSEIFTERWP